MLNKNRTAKKSLPKIHCQKKTSLTFDQRDNSRDMLTNRLISNQTQMKRTLSAASAFKAVRYETTGILYAKKVQQLQKQNKSLDLQIKKLQQEIDIIRKNIAKISKNDQSRSIKNAFVTQPVSILHDNKAIHHKSINGYDQKSLNNQIKTTDNKIQILRKKIDQQNQKNEKLKKDVNVVRKQIINLKNLCKCSQSSLQQTNSQYNHYCQMLKKLEGEVSAKNNIVHKIRMQSEHKKAQTIKQYDNILKHLQKQLGSDKANKKSQQINPNILQLANKKINSTTQGSKTIMSPMKSKINFYTQMPIIKQKLQKCQKQFQSLQNLTGTHSTDQAVQQFYRDYDKNFGFYQFINELYMSLQDKQKQNQQIKNKKQLLISEIANRLSDVREGEIAKIKSAIEVARAQRVRHNAKSNEFQQITDKLKQTIKQFYLKINMKSDKQIQDINQQTMSSFLDQIRIRCSQLDTKYQEKQFKTNSQTGEPYPVDALENVKKEGCETSEQRSEKVVSRDEFIKVKNVALLKQKPTHQKRQSKK